MLTLSITLELASLAGCHADKTGGGNSQSNGNGNQASGSGGTSQQGGSGSGAKSGSSAKGGGGSQQLTEPSESTTGVPTGPVAAASDDGSPRAVGHSSTAMPGAPQATLNGRPQQDKPLDSPEAPANPPPKPH